MCTMHSGMSGGAWCIMVPVRGALVHGAKKARVKPRCHEQHSEQC